MHGALNAALGAARRRPLRRRPRRCAAPEGADRESGHPRRRAHDRPLDDLLKAEEAAASAAAAPVDGGGAAAEKGLAPPRARRRARCGRRRRGCASGGEGRAARGGGGARDGGGRARFVDLFFGKGKAKDLKFGDE